MRKLLASAAVLALLSSPVSAAGISIAWQNQSDNTTSFPSGTSMNIGATNQNHVCTAITAGQLMLAFTAVWANATNDAGVPTTPTGWLPIPKAGGGNWTYLSAVGTGDIRLAGFYKIAVGGETCSFPTSWANTAATGSQAWQLIVLDYIGTPPGTVVDVADGAGDFVNNTVVTPSISPTNANDFLIGVFVEPGVKNPYTKPSDMTLIQSVGGGSLDAEIMTAQRTLSAAGATGTETWTLTGTFAKVATGLIALNVGSGAGTTFHGLVTGLGVGK